MSKILVSIVPASLLVLAVLTNVGCATSFRGNAHFPGGPAGCRARCRSIGGTMAQFVYVGDYSSACVCGAPDATTTAGGAGSSSAAAVAVMTQMRNEEARAHQRR
ncbi:hypothetical protein [Sandaracinus amylolyticus]|uniref:hypothetical protein n=1 Tax=Sandaracinus amylolyticus TaxID=927083 RepID=UPI001F230A90|nr:hypothetical protein [Sandaracinus amylolyticus]UJR85991.1 Hypothetical protein I5071_80720 [Sandaracinus amylolyticus]